MEHIPEFISNHILLVSMLAGVAALLIWNVMKDSFSGIPQVSPAEMTRLINHEDALVLDVRSTGEFSNGHVLNAINIPAADLEVRGKELVKYHDSTVVVCNSGVTSAKTIQVLKAAGLDKVYNLKGGLYAWQNAGLPLSRGKQ
ncbi:MAG: hypothetical protein A3I78_08890 [Gammaproteobacteria bacterium RIFCSPLOWO2_02_FULL_56_15]|nr:MAG: hypothetical protein A3I78_08890 [Gammaproteobacteria bacterium RIFCSPLOWO2_02_FULL_56_15]